MCKQINLFEGEKEELAIENLSKSAFLKDLPFDKIYDIARKEASRKKPVFFIHKYFARRITCNFRVMLLGALLPENADIWENFYNSNVNEDLEKLVVLDPFMGGGTTLFEASRLKAKVIGNDLQPLSKFVSTALIKNIDEKRINKQLKELEKNVSEKIKKYYTTKCPECKKNADIMYVFHVKTSKTNSDCKEHELYSNYVLAMKKNIFTLVCPECGEVYEHDFKKNGIAKCPSCSFEIINPKDGKVKRGVFECTKCGEKKVVSDYKNNKDYPMATKLIAIEYYCPHCNTHKYKKIDKEDLELYELACRDYENIKNILPIPEQEIPMGYNTRQIINHGYNKFSDLFNKRQLLCLGLLLKSINEIDDHETQFWLQLAFSGMLEMNNMFCRYQANAYKICNLFFNHAYVPITMPVENCVWGTKFGTGTFIKTVNKIIRGKKFCTDVYDIDTEISNGKIKSKKVYSKEYVKDEPVNNIDLLDVEKPFLNCGDSRNLSFIKDKSVDIVLTDPPFGANVMYSELIDFFHVWNYKSSLANELGFIEPLSPKKAEIIVNETQNKNQDDYKTGLREVFTECNRVMKDNGFLIFSFHDKSIDSWLSILGSIDLAGFYLKKAYPLHAETRTGAHTSNKNSIALDIMLICAKKTKSERNTYSDKKDAIIKEAMNKTKDVIERLEKVNAEITIPDIENIYISNFFETVAEEELDFRMIMDDAIIELKEILQKLDDIFKNSDITEKRTGWWAKLYQEKWDV